ECIVSEVVLGKPAFPKPERFCESNLVEHLGIGLVMRHASPLTVVEQSEVHAYLLCTWTDIVALSFPPLAQGGGGRILPKGGNNWCPGTELMGKWLACGKPLRHFAGQTRLKIVWQYDNVKGEGTGMLDRLRYAAYARRVLRGSALLWY